MSDLSCNKCHSTNLVKRGTHLKANGVREQIYQCKICGHHVLNKLSDAEPVLIKIETVDAEPLPDGYISLEKAQELIKAKWHKDITPDSIRHWADEKYLVIKDIDNTLIVEEKSLKSMFEKYTL